MKADQENQLVLYSIFFFIRRARRPKMADDSRGSLFNLEVQFLGFEIKIKCYFFYSEIKHRQIILCVFGAERHLCMKRLKL